MELVSGYLMKQLKYDRNQLCNIIYNKYKLSSQLLMLDFNVNNQLQVVLPNRDDVKVLLKESRRYLEDGIYNGSKHNRLGKELNQVVKEIED
jgi:hypothetical protein